jgi:hypothetical protein
MGPISAPQHKDSAEPTAEPQELGPKAQAAPLEPENTGVDDTDPSMTIPDFGPMDGIDEAPEEQEDPESKT